MFSFLSKIFKKSRKKDEKKAEKFPTIHSYSQPVFVGYRIGTEKINDGHRVIMGPLSNEEIKKFLSEGGSVFRFPFPGSVQIISIDDKGDWVEGIVGNDGKCHLNVPSHD